MSCFHYSLTGQRLHKPGEGRGVGGWVGVCVCLCLCVCALQSNTLKNRKVTGQPQGGKGGGIFRQGKPHSRVDGAGRAPTPPQQRCWDPGEGDESLLSAGTLLCSCTFTFAVGGKRGGAQKCSGTQEGPERVGLGDTLPTPTAMGKARAPVTAPTGLTLTSAGTPPPPPRGSPVPPPGLQHRGLPAASQGHRAALPPSPPHPRTGFEVVFRVFFPPPLRIYAAPRAPGAAVPPPPRPSPPPQRERAPGPPSFPRRPIEPRRAGEPSPAPWRPLAGAGAGPRRGRGEEGGPACSSLSLSSLPPRTTLPMRPRGGRRNCGAPQGVVGRRLLPFRWWAPSGEGLFVLSLSRNPVPSRARGGHPPAALLSPPAATPARWDGAAPAASGRCGTGSGARAGRGPWALGRPVVEGPPAAPCQGRPGRLGCGAEREGEGDTQCGT